MLILKNVYRFLFVFNILVIIYGWEKNTLHFYLLNVRLYTIW